MTDTVPAAQPGLPHRVPQASLAEIADQVGADVLLEAGDFDAARAHVQVLAMPSFGASHPHHPHPPLGAVPPLLYDELVAKLGDPRPWRVETPAGGLR